MNTPIQWAKAHSLKALAWSLIIITICIIAGYIHSPWLMVFDSLLVVVWMNLAYLESKRDVRKVKKHMNNLYGPLPIFLCAAFIWPTQIQAQELSNEAYPVQAPFYLFEPYGGIEQNSLGYVVGGVLIIGGLIIGYKVVRFCQRKFPKNPPPPTNQPPDEIIGAIGTDDNNYGAGWTYTAMGSCYSPAPFHAASEPVPLYLFKITGRITELDTGPELRIISLVQTNEADLLSPTEWQASLTAWGLTLTGRPGESSYSKNGVPVTDPAGFPFVLNNDATHTVSIGNYPVYTVVYEKSVDLVEWLPIVAMHVSPGYDIKFEDISGSEQMFYRMRLQ